MYTFNRIDQRLQRLMEASIFIFESFAGFEHKYEQLGDLGLESLVVLKLVHGNLGPGGTFCPTKEHDLQDLMMTDGTNSHVSCSAMKIVSSRYSMVGHSGTGPEAELLVPWGKPPRTWGFPDLTNQFLPTKSPTSI